ncbi:MAG: multi-sensor hybrid histidine kinase [Holophagaceae bacterium]|nr:multi-sensor hybrid histidine kinase [Holophagaceae bacterium]
MTASPKTGIFLRTFLMFLLVPVLAVAFFILLVVTRQRAMMVRSLDAQVQGTLASVVNINSSVYIREDYGSIVEINTMLLKENPDIRYLVTSRKEGTCILNREGHWELVDLQSPEFRWLDNPVSRVIEKNPLTGERVYHCVYPVRFYDMEWGMVYLGVSLKTHDAQIRRMYVNTLSVGAGGVILAALLAWFFTRRLTTPLLRLRDVAERIRGGDLGVRARIRTGDELEQLGDSFNAMAESIQQLNEGLEARVQERTLELLRSEERYRLLFDNASEAIFVLQQGRVRFWNPVLRQMTGFGGGQLTGARFEELVVEEDRMGFLDLMAKAESTRASVVREGLRLERLNGEHVWVDVNCVAIQWDEDPALLFFVQDISERRTLQVQLFHAQKMEAIGTLAGGIAHDFNNLLAGILGYVSILQIGKEAGTPEYDWLQKIERQISSATGLTRQLLGFARGGTYETRPRDLNQIIHGALDLFARTKRQIQIQLDLEDEGCVVDCDRGQIEQVLVNLFVNAAHAMPEGGTLTVRSSLREYGEELTEPLGLSPGCFVEVAVQDTGIGMDEATKARIFDPFFTTKELGGGTGLGLASVYGILKNHGGLIRVESQPGMGSTFTFALPQSSATLVLREQHRQKDIRPGEGIVLLVDDQEIIRNVGQSMLEMIGYQVLTAPGGAEGVALFEENKGRIDLVILDMIMPGMSGGQTFQRLRAIDPEIPVILASGYSLDGEVESLLACGCNGFLQKPFNAVQLAEKIGEVLGV